MPKVYILPDIIIHDRDVPSYFYPDSASRYSKNILNWQTVGENLIYSDNAYTIFLDGIELPKKKGTPHCYDPYVPNEYYGKIGQWGLFSFDVTPGEHTIKIEAHQESYYEEKFLGKTRKGGHRVNFSKPYQKINNKFNKEICFNVGNGNAFFYYYLEFEQYYPVLTCVHESVFGAPHGTFKTDGLNEWFCRKIFKYSINNKFSFQQIDYSTLKSYLDKRMSQGYYNAYNEPIPKPNADDETHIVNFSLMGAEVKTNAVQDVKNSDNKTTLTLNVTNEEKEISLKVQPIEKKTEPKIVIKEVIKNTPYYETAGFKKLMQDYEYEIASGEVVLKKVLNTKKEMIVPNGVSIIKNNAFGDYLKDVVLVHIPYSVTTIESGAFENNKSLEKIVIDANITTIKQNTFSGCVNLKEITLPPTLKQIESGSFDGVGADVVFVPFNAKVEEGAFNKNVKVVKGNKKTLEIQEKVKQAIELESSINVREEVSKISAPVLNLNDIKTKYDEEIEQIEKGNLEKLEEYKQDLERFDLTYMSQEKALENYDEQKKQLIKDFYEQEAKTQEYYKKWLKLLQQLGNCYDENIKKKYPTLFKK